MTTRASEGGPKEQTAKQKWPRETHLITYVKGKVFYDQEPPRGESTTTESGVNYQLLSVMH